MYDKDTVYFFINYIFFFIGSFKYFFTYQFCFASLALRERFKLLNDFLKKLVIDNKFKFSSTSTTFDNLKSVTELHLDLCDLIELINSTFTAHLIFILLSVLVRDDYLNLLFVCLNNFFVCSRKQFSMDLQSSEIS